MKKTLLSTLSFVIAFIFSSCTKESITIYYAYLKNKSTHQIQIKPYSLGTVVTANIITLTPDQEIKIADGTDRGIQINGGFSSPNFSNADSLVVIFDGLYSITHYFKNPVSTALKYYLNTSTRNLGNKNSYVLVGEDLSKHRRKNSYYYDFTEQDYLDAR